MNDCEPYPGRARYEFGYGVKRVPGTRTNTTAHRWRWEQENGPVPEGMQINHHCDNPECWNPDHLYLGTQKENMRDAIERGRAPQAIPHGKHGRRGMYARGCRCAACVGHNRKRARDYRRRKRDGA